MVLDSHSVGRTPKDGWLECSALPLPVQCLLYSFPGLGGRAFVGNDNLLDCVLLWYRYGLSTGDFYWNKTDHC